ncbi:MAG: hypothetical protein AB7O65_00730 [Candidatus Korobacteraceae bacterium]
MRQFWVRYLRTLAADYILLAFLTFVVSVTAFVHYARSGDFLLYGDSVAHINIARRLLDSRTPGPLQLGTAWLPLSHLLMAPFVFFDWAWKTGVGGSIPSMVAYVLATLGIFRLTRHGFEFMGSDSTAARIAAWTAAVVFAANPNLIYLQSTAMTEPLSLAAFLWAMVFFGQFVENMLGYSEFAPEPDPRDSAHAGRALRRCAWCLAAWMLIRYDGWYAAVAFTLAAAMVFSVGAKRRGLSATHFMWHWKWKGPLVRFLLILVAAPGLWFAHNAYYYGNPVEFATGPYSARGIEQRTRRPGEAHHPGWDAPHIGALYFVKAAKLNLGEWSPSGATFFPLALAGTALVLLFSPGLRYWLLLWFPIAAYAVSIAWGGIPIFMPPWYPYSYYNVRYGVQLLPAIAVFSAAAVYFSLAIVRARPWRVVVPALMAALVGACYLQAWAATPISLREPRSNSAVRMVLERGLANQLRELPKDSTILMYTGEYGRALQIAGIPFRRTVNEGNRRDWARALKSPANAADYIVAAPGDEIGQALGSHLPRLRAVAVVKTPPQGIVTVYAGTRRQ